MSPAAIELNKLSKRYGRSRAYALKDLSLTVAPGEIYGFLGPNGAGKSTTIRTLLNFIQPSGGSAGILGLDIVNDSVAIKKHVGYLAGEIALYKDMTGRQFLDYMSALQPVKSREYLKQLIDRFDAQLDKPIENLSKGNRQKIGLIQALMHQPEVLILDEPTSGLDPLMQEEFFKTVRQAQENGAALFISSHNFAEVLRMCDRVGIIRDGRLVGEESIAKLQAKAAHTFVITFAGKAPVDELKKIKQAKTNQVDDQHVRVQLQGELKPLFAVLAKHEVTRLDQEEVNLEREFMRFYEDES